MTISPPGLVPKVPPSLNLETVTRTVDDSEDVPLRKRESDSPGSSSGFRHPSPSARLGLPLHVSLGSPSTPRGLPPPLNHSCSEPPRIQRPRYTLGEKSGKSKASGGNEGTSPISRSSGHTGASTSASSEHKSIASPRTPRGTSPRIQTYEKDAIEVSVADYKSLPLIDQSKGITRKKIDRFNSALEKDIADRLENAVLGQFFPHLVDQTMTTDIEKKPYNFCLNVRNFSSYTKKELMEVHHILHQRILQKLQQYNPLTGWFVDRIMKFHHSFVEIINSRQQRSQWSDEILDRVKRVYSHLLEYPTPLESSEYILRISDHKIRALLLRAFNSDEGVAESSFERARLWSRDEHLNVLIRQGIKRVFKAYIKTPLLFDKVKSLRFVSNQTKKVVPLIEGVDLEQVARSYIVSTEPICASVVINRQPLDQRKREGSVASCQSAYFQDMLSMIYRNLLPGCSLDYVKEQVNCFLRKEKIPGHDILTLASNSGWSLCDSMLRSLYPSLFTGAYRTRMQRGIGCEIDVEDENFYDLSVERNYFVFEADPANPDSIYVQDDHPLFGIQVKWEIERKSSDKGLIWESNLSFTNLERKQADDDQFYDILMKLLKFVPIPGLHLPLPESEALRRALELT